MICARCAHAADLELGRDKHCDAQGGPDARCACQHRTDRYSSTGIAITTDSPSLMTAVHTGRQ